jgi:hypothetical protein
MIFVRCRPFSDTPLTTTGVQNPVMKVKVPSDKDAVRIHVLTQPEEMQYFTAAAEIPHLYDLGRLMIYRVRDPTR